MASNSDIFRSSSSSIASSENLLDNLSSEHLVSVSSENLLANMSSENLGDESSAVVMEEEDKEMEEEDKEKEELKKENQALKQKIMELEIKKKDQDRILHRYERTLELFEKEKNGLEDKLDAKFLPVLNAKKEEILRLQMLLALKAKDEEDDKIKRQKL